MALLPKIIGTNSRSHEPEIVADGGNAQPRLRSMSTTPDSWIDPTGHEPAVLVVDDNLVVVKLMIQTLSPYGVRCHWVRSVEEAQEVLGAFHVDLVIADIRPPLTDGIALAHWIRAQRAIADVPIVFFTSVNDRETIRAAASIPNVDYVLKPLRRKIFCERIFRKLTENRERA